MGEFQPLIEKLADDRLDGLAADDMGVHNLREVVDMLRLIRRELEAGEDLTPEEIPTQVHNDILGGTVGQQIDALIEGMTTYGAATENPAQERTQFMASAQRLRDLVIERLRPIVRTDEAKVQQRLAQVEVMTRDVVAMRDSLAHTLAETQKQQAALAQSSASAAASDLSTYYTDQANTHARSARTFLTASAIAGGVLAVLTVVALFIVPPDYTAAGTSEQWIEVVRGTVARLAALSIVAFALAFCVRNYRVNMHLEVLNKRRENALNTFGLMQASVTSEDARNIVVGELVRAVFTSEDTGYLNADTERTVIESPGGAGMLSAMSAMARGQTQ